MIQNLLATLAFIVMTLGYFLYLYIVWTQFENHEDKMDGSYWAPRKRRR